MKKINILLIMPRIVNKIGEGYQFPLGLPYISAALKKEKFNVYTYNLNHYEGEVKILIAEQIKKHNINAVFTGGLSFQYYPIRELVEAVKSIDPSIFVLVGGGIITGDPIPAMKALQYADVGVIGEGEITDVEVCKALETGSPLESVDGLIIKKEDGSYYITPPRKEIEDLDSIPWPDYDGFEIEKSFQSTPGVSGLNSTRTLFMLGSRSCPYQCSFCFHTVGKKYRQRSMDNFFEEIDYNIKKYKLNYLFIADELFSYNTQRVEEFCDRIKPYNIQWWAQFRVDSLDDWVLKKVKESGCSVMSFGLESADNSVLKSMGKNITIEQIDKTLAQVHQAGIAFEGAFIFGDEAESYETAQNTLKYWLDHAEYKINLNTITVFPGCRLYKNAVRNGIIKDPVKYLQDGCPQINNTKMSNQQYADIIQKIVSYPFEKAKKFKEYCIADVDYNMARISVDCTCSDCGHHTTFHKVKLFMTNFLSCPVCGQRYNITLDSKITDRIGQNIANLLEKYNKIAVWGVNYNTFQLFRHVKQLQMEHIYPIDSSEIKQELFLEGKKVTSPTTITCEGIDLVVIAIPAYFNQISLQIKYQFPNVKEIVDICDLLTDKFDE